MNRLTPRERLYVYVGGAFLAVVVGWFGIVRPYTHAIDRAQARIESGRVDLDRMVELYRTFSEIQARIADKERRIREGGEGTVLTALEGLAAQANVSDKIESMEERKKPANDFYKENAVEVSVRKVTLGELVDFLHQVESAPTLLLVRKLTVSSRFDQKGLLDARVEVSSFEPL
jgi:type II secretory pathway component PulM